MQLMVMKFQNNITVFLNKSSEGISEPVFSHLYMTGNIQLNANYLTKSSSFVVPQLMFSRE